MVSRAHETEITLVCDKNAGGRCEEQKGLTGKTGESLLDINHIYGGDVRSASKVQAKCEIRKWCERAAYSMRSRTVPTAGTKKMNAYYDWGQRPCPSPPLPENKYARISGRHHQRYL